MEVQNAIEQKLRDAFFPNVLVVNNESYMHNVPKGSESHFKVTVVSDSFENKRLLQRHRAVNQVLAEELAEKIHALAIHCYTQEEWLKQGLQAPESPACRGGGK